MMRAMLVVSAILLFSLPGWTADEASAPAGTPATPTAGASPTESSTSMEKALTAEGARVIWRRSPAKEADLGMPIFGKGLVLDSFCYRIRDRRRNDLINFARVFISTTEPTQDLVDFYLPALGPTVQRSTKKQTGEIFLAAGTKANFRLVVITPRNGFTHLRLEHVQQFSAPPRVFTAREQRVLRVLADIGNSYSATRHVAYHIHERTTYSDEKPRGDEPDLTSAVDFARPAQVSLSITRGNATLLTISTKEGNLEILRPGKPVERRAIEGSITFDMLPELDDDPVARLMLGGSLLTPDVDYLALEPVNGVPIQSRAEVVMTLPDYNATLHLLLDMQKRLLLRSEMIVNENGYQTHVTRVFTDQVLEPAPGGLSTPTPAPPAATHAPTATTGT